MLKLPDKPEGKRTPLVLPKYGELKSGQSLLPQPRMSQGRPLSSTPVEPAETAGQLAKRTPQLRGKHASESEPEAPRPRSRK